MLPTHTNDITIPKGRVFLKVATDDAYRYLGSNQISTLTREVVVDVLKRSSDNAPVAWRTTSINYRLNLKMSDVTFSEKEVALKEVALLIIANKIEYLFPSVTFKVKGDTLEVQLLKAWTHRKLQYRRYFKPGSIGIYGLYKLLLTR